MSKSILLCDDEVYIVRAAEIKFRHAGYDVRTAGDGEEAWAAIRAARPDVVVTDCQMPRLDGLGLVRRIREDPATADLPVLMLTGKGFELDREELAARWNVLEVVAKPFSPRDLLARVEAILQVEMK
ncbi:MAG: response regulator [Thermoguttaceae bacterium]|jgi:DNA-binding response OmpR family regulator